MHARKHAIQFERLIMTHVVTTAAALDALSLPDDGVRLLRVAPDEAFLYPATEVSLSDEWALVKDVSGWAGVWVSAETGKTILEHTCEWEVPSERPILCQGEVAGIPTKLWVEADRTLFLVSAAFSAELEARLNL